ncbi:hypothetical protein KP509_28G003900 [Ceratopteris richardii]|uniref:Uncharacterized protein n=1 Tax=Ceratopteris richardii TaxID=49495 RepID=A0A8T2R933_CERRI|nr:hypothetical protein KP509_28G003900 [Ceratopteris richardii]
MENPLVNVLDGEYRGLVTQDTVNDVDIFNIYRIQAQPGTVAKGESDGATDNDSICREKEQTLINENGQERERQDQRNKISDVKRKEILTHKDSAMSVRGEETNETNLASAIRTSEGDSAQNLDFQDRAASDDELISSDWCSHEQLAQLDVPYDPRNGPSSALAHLNRSEQTQLSSSNVCSTNNRVTGPDVMHVSPSDKVENSCGSLQNSEGTVIANSEVSSTSSHDDKSRVADSVSERLVRSAEMADNDKKNVDPLQNDDVDRVLHTDKLSNHCEDEEYMSGTFSGPIAFSGMLAYSGMLSQVPHSGNLSMHSDSSTSTRSFAFPMRALI